MRIFMDDKEQEVLKVICNQCKRELLVENGIVKEGYYEGRQNFGFFSKKDGQAHYFDLCEECYDNMIESFSIPVDIKNITELL